MADNTHTSGHWLNTDGYKKLDKTQQSSIQNDFVNMNKNQQAGKFNGENAYTIAKKYGLYTPPTVDQKVQSVNDSHKDTIGKIQGGYYENPENYKYLMNDEKYAYDLYKQTGDLTRWGGYKKTGSSPYDDLFKMFGIPQEANLGNEGMYDAWKRQDHNFKANTMAGNAMGLMPNASIGGGGFDGGGAGVGGEFEDFMKMFMEMMMGAGQVGKQEQPKFQPLQYGDGVHLFKQEDETK